MGHFADRRQTVRKARPSERFGANAKHDGYNSTFGGVRLLYLCAETLEFRPRDRRGDRRPAGARDMLATRRRLQEYEDIGSKMTLDHFPPEVLASVFSYLSEYEVKTASDVNTRWRDIASNWVLEPRAHLLLSNPPNEASQTPFHTIHIDGATTQLLHHFNQIKHHLAHLHTIVLYGVWTHQQLLHLSNCLSLLPSLTTLEISGASPSHHIYDFLSIRHDITKIRCFLNANQSKSFRKVCERLRTTHGLFEEVAITQKTPQGLEAYIPKPTSLKYPQIDSTTNLTIHPARLSDQDFDQICSFKYLESLTLNHPKRMPGNFLTNLSPTLRKLELNNAKTVSHDNWIRFFKSPVMKTLEVLSISGQNKIDSSIFDNLDKNRNLRKLYLQIHCPCADQCGLRSLLTWSPNIEVLVLYIPYSSDGVYDLLNTNKDAVKKLQTLKILFQVTPDMAEPKCNESVKQFEELVRKALPGVFVEFEIRNHVREFLCDDEDDFE